MTAEPTTTQHETAPQTDESPVEADALVEEVSIDGMCGVY
ncbi:mycofactocin precursor MftA [Georgenia alba]|uniref:Mycofactocin MftA n=1 Tax=Georgenia alba TaxID=2233858 RepID=A0ABW2Q6G2_9MICO